MSPPPVDLSINDLISEALLRHEAALFRYANRLLRDEGHARDIVQETFAALGSTPPSAWLDHTGAWLFTVCRRKSLNLLRKLGRISLLDENATAQLVSHEPSPAALAQRDDDRRLILELVEKLPPNQREIVRLRYQEGFSYQEISRITELTSNHVGVLLHNAVQAMRHQWEKHQRPRKTKN